MRRNTTSFYLPNFILNTSFCCLNLLLMVLPQWRELAFYAFIHIKILISLALSLLTTAETPERHSVCVRAFSPMLCLFLFNNPSSTCYSSKKMKTFGTYTRCQKQSRRKSREQRVHGCLSFCLWISIFLKHNRKKQEIVGKLNNDLH